jgi:transaldolase
MSLAKGRDTGVDPVPVMAEAVEVLRPLPKAELLWASSRELLNILQADAIGCHIITATPDVLGKLKLLGKNLDEYSLEAVMQFYQDAGSAGYHIS